MAHVEALVGTIIAAIVLYFGLQKWSEWSRYNEAADKHRCKLPRRYPNWDPFLGLDLFAVIRKADAAGQRSQFYAQLHQKYGDTFEMKALGAAQIQTAQPENIRAISATQFSDFGVGPMRGNIGAPFLDRGVFTEDGEYWKHSRALIRPTFNRAEIADLTNFEIHVSRFLALIPPDSRRFDIQPLLKRLFLDTSTEFLFGRSVESLLPERAFDAADFLKAFDRSLLGLAIRLIAGPLKPLLIYDPAWKKAYTKVHTFVDEHVAIALNQQPVSTNKTGQTGKYVLLQQMAMETKDPYELRNEILNVFFPARDTAAIAFGYVLFDLARHPHIWDELRTEVMSLGSQQLTFELLKDLSTTKAIINETLRLHLPASRIARVALRDTVLPVGGGYDGLSPLFMPKGQVVEMDLYTVQRDPKFWGDDAGKFNPRRWRVGRPLWEANWQYEPFLGGTRMCPAQNQVLTQISYLLVRIAQEFSAIRNEDEVLDYVEEIRMTVESRNGVQISLVSA